MEESKQLLCEDDNELGYAYQYYDASTMDTIVKIKYSDSDADASFFNVDPKNAQGLGNCTFERTLNMFSITTTRLIPQMFDFVGRRNTTNYPSGLEIDVTVHNFADPKKSSQNLLTKKSYMLESISSKIVEDKVFYTYKFIKSF